MTTTPATSNASALTLDAIRDGGKKALARALSALEAEDGSLAVARLLDEAARNARAHVVGLTGPPGVGKSTLTNAIIRHWRANGERVGVLAVDPSSRFSQGALLGDRTRLDTDPRDKNIFVRSMAARDRLGGLSNEAVAAIVLMRALFDRVLVESVGIGQSEADIAFATDTVILCIQPGSGDSLQFMKAGVMELPDVIVVTKADVGKLATRAKADLEGALSLTMRKDKDWTVPVLLVSAFDDTGLQQLIAEIDRHYGSLLESEKFLTIRQDQATIWLLDRIRRKFGEIGLAQINARDFINRAGGPFMAEKLISEDLSQRLAKKVGDL
ncbi:methylmalonyl Co-A mutase-associated GTPase MeaB [uncultured Cohaesibacter sp.]|uniref:methylmalonyl Co-A mutase-associated GTPase MeaB n=1 Tax=uncultured Cohaesibacter sp. TaxID=1002546 RepID=UPI0029C73C43|nr:methylmalonyl Co-A mutase-associated GTPase MeaB [uncultured Cohaesibacter sp.]